MKEPENNRQSITLSRWLGPLYVRTMPSEIPGEEIVLIRATAIPEAHLRMKSIDQALPPDIDRRVQVRMGNSSNYLFGQGHYAKLHIDYGSKENQKLCHAWMRTQLHLESTLPQAGCDGSETTGAREYFHTLCKDGKATSLTGMTTRPLLRRWCGQRN